jgi:beta-galactosidase/beta-glucuronidase
VGIGYNPIYRNLPAQTRLAMYRKDFIIMCRAGVNTITGWDADKGYDQDKFDELTLDTANQYGIGVVMPVYLPPDADYRDPSVVAELAETAREKVERFKGNPGVRMWGIGNEVMNNMANPDMYQPFLAAYLSIIDVVHQIDTNHPVIYREAEDDFVPAIVQALHDSGDPRPWFLYGMNVYDKPPGPILDRWPAYELDRPLFVSEFGAEGKTAADRAQGYASMWRAIRAHRDWVAGGAPYAWTTAGPEPTDSTWGLMDGNSWPVDGTFGALQQLWRAEPRANHGKCA